MKWVQPKLRRTAARNTATRRPPQHIQARKNGGGNRDDGKTFEIKKSNAGEIAPSLKSPHFSGSNERIYWNAVVDLESQANEFFLSVMRNVSSPKNDHRRPTERQYFMPDCVRTVDFKSVKSLRPRNSTFPEKNRRKTWRNRATPGCAAESMPKL